MTVSEQLKQQYRFQLFIDLAVNSLLENVQKLWLKRPRHQEHALFLRFQQAVQAIEYSFAILHKSYQLTELRRQTIYRLVSRTAWEEP